MNILDKRLQEIENISDTNVDTSDIPELDEDFWTRAVMVKPSTQKTVSIRIDEDILDWFKSQEKNYQTLMNDVLRSYFKHQQK